MTSSVKKGDKKNGVYRQAGNTNGLAPVISTVLAVAIGMLVFKASTGQWTFDKAAAALGRENTLEKSLHVGTTDRSEYIAFRDAGALGNVAMWKGFHIEQAQVEFDQAGHKLAAFSLIVSRTFPDAELASFDNLRGALKSDCGTNWSQNEAQQVSGMHVAETNDVVCMIQERQDQPEEVLVQVNLKAPQQTAAVQQPQSDPTPEPTQVPSTPAAPPVAADDDAPTSKPVLSATAQAGQLELKPNDSGGKRLYLNQKPVLDKDGKAAFDNDFVTIWKSFRINGNDVFVIANQCSGTICGALTYRFLTITPQGDITIAGEIEVSDEVVPMVDQRGNQIVVTALIIDGRRQTQTRWVYENGTVKVAS